MYIACTCYAQVVTPHASIDLSRLIYRLTDTDRNVVQTSAVRTRTGRNRDDKWLGRRDVDKWTADDGRPARDGGPSGAWAVVKDWLRVSPSGSTVKVIMRRESLDTIVITVNMKVSTWKSHATRGRYAAWACPSCVRIVIWVLPVVGKFALLVSHTFVFKNAS